MWMDFQRAAKTHRRLAIFAPRHVAKPLDG
jgi:hypothetical protein